MSSKLIMSAFFLLTGCHFGAEGHIGAGERHNEGTTYEQEYSDGYGPVLVDTYAECWRLPGGGYGWYFDAAAEHTGGGAFLNQVDSVWVDIYYGLKHVTYELHDDIVLYSPLDAPGAAMYDYETAWGDGVFMRAEYEATTALDCSSPVQYEIHTTAYDIEGNYHTVVEYL